MPLAIAVIALVLRLWAPGPVTQTQDEYNWLLRSDTFRTALLDRDIAAATVTGGGTMPGVTTMWAGTFGHVSSGQRGSPIDARMDRDARRYGTLVKTVSIGGVHYAELRKIRHPVRH